MGQEQNLELCPAAQFPGPWQAPRQGCPLSFKERCPQRAGPALRATAVQARPPPHLACPRCLLRPLPVRLTVAPPPWLCPPPCHSGGWAHRPHSFPGPPCPMPARGGTSVAKGARHACRGLSGLFIRHTGAAPWHLAHRNGSTSHQARQWVGD